MLVGGSPNPSDYEKQILKHKSPDIILPGFLYGSDVHTLIKNAILYVQPSDVKGLSPVILQVMGMGSPLLCSDIRENLFIVKEDAITFRKADVNDLIDKLRYCLDNPNILDELSERGRVRILKEFSWDTITKQHIKVFGGEKL